MPPYSIAGAYANDWLPSDRITAAAGQLILMYGVGAMIGPLIGSAAMSHYGTDGFVWTAIVCHLAIRGVPAGTPVPVPAAVPRQAMERGRAPGRVFLIPVTVVGMGQAPARSPPRRARQLTLGS